VGTTAYQCMLIRTEIPVDAIKIDRLLRHVFNGNDEADLVQQLREDGLLTLGMVATDDEGDVIGYAAFSPVTIMDEDLQWVGLAPLAVDEAYRRQGIGKSLVYEGLDSLNEFGYAAVVTLGDAAYYRQRLGFLAAKDHQLHCRWPGSEDAFLVYPLAENAFDGISGLVSYSPPFDRF
jgi:putative acetyltransferase